MRTLAQQDGSFLRRCKSQSGSFVSFEQRYSDRQNMNSCGVVGRPPHHKRFTPVNVRLPLNTGDEIKAKERRNQIRPREGNILQMPAQREKKSCAASCLNVFFCDPLPPAPSHPLAPARGRRGSGAALVTSTINPYEENKLGFYKDWVYTGPHPLF